jgi:hypothetical protein
MDSEQIIASTSKWVKQIVIGLNFCPFANQPFIKNQIYYHVYDASSISDIEIHLQKMIDLLINNPTIETVLIIFPTHFASFSSFLQGIKRAERYLEKKKYTNDYLIAHFHPNYIFNGVDKDDTSNYTNRSPYPILHLIKQSSIDKAKSSFKHIELIPEQNIKVAQKLGANYFEHILNCLKK